MGIDNSGRFLDHLAANRVFTFVDASAGAYRYHNLFREFLTHRFVQDHGITSFRELQSQTAAVLEKAGHIERAVELLLSANEPADALAAIARGGETVLERCETDRLESWLERLQPGPAAGHPWARLTASQLLARSGNYDRALDEIERALTAFENTDDGWGIYHALSLKESALYWQGSPEQAAAVCREALKLTFQEAQRVHTLLSLASAMLSMRSWQEADVALEAARELAVHSSAAELARAQGLSGYRLYFTGHFHEAKEVLAPGPWQDKGLHSNAFPISLAAALGMTELGLGNYGEAGALLERALESARQRGLASAAEMVLDSLGLLKGSQGHMEEGLEALRLATRGVASASDPVHAALVLSHEASILRRFGNLEMALERHLESAAMVSPSRDAYTALNCRANADFTECLLDLNSPAALDEIASLAFAHDLQFVGLKANLYAGVAADELGDRARAQRILSESVPRQLAFGHRHILNQELCVRPELAAALLISATRPVRARDLMDALARHWRFSDVVRALAAEAPHLAPAAIQAATRHSSEEDLRQSINAVRGLHSGKLSDAVDSAYRERALSGMELHDQLADLTRREKQVLALMADGKRNDEMASELFVSLPTVKTHVNHIFTKLGVANRVQAVRLYNDSVRT